MGYSLGALDWAIVGAYFLLLGLTSVVLAQNKIKTSRDYFTAGNKIPFFAAAVSILATSQSAATFLGAPEYAYRHDLSFIGFYFSALFGVFFVAYWLIPRFYTLHSVTVYEFLGQKYGTKAQRYTGGMFLVGQLLSSGVRLYIAALAISMILFLDISPLHVGISIIVLVIGALAYTYAGGVRSVIFSDIIQAMVYIGAAFAVLWHLYGALDSDFDLIVQTLQSEDKLRFVKWSGDYGVWSLLSGWLLLNIAAYGLNQDMTQRALTCTDANAAKKSLFISILLTIPVAFVFLVIGLLLYLYYHHPELSSFDGVLDATFHEQKITVFMVYILNEMEYGLKGLVVVGVIAAALSSSNSILGSMASVALQDIYRPFFPDKSEEHFLKVSRIAVLGFAVALSLMAMVAYYWQRYSDIPLITFALGVMTFAYAGLLGVYGAAIFTKKGNGANVPWALVGGFISVGVFGFLLEDFAWQLVFSTIISFCIMLISRKSVS